MSRGQPPSPRLRRAKTPSATVRSSVLLLDTCYLELRALSARYILKLLLSVKIALTMA